MNDGLKNILLFLVGVALAVFIYRRFRDKSFLEIHYENQQALSNLGATKTSATLASVAPNSWLDMFPGTVWNANPFSGTDGVYKTPTALPTLGITP